MRDPGRGTRPEVADRSALISRISLRALLCFVATRQRLLFVCVLVMFAGPVGVPPMAVQQRL